jgi:hypothetical protein
MSILRSVSMFLARKLKLKKKRRKKTFVLLIYGNK